MNATIYYVQLFGKGMEMSNVNDTPQIIGLVFELAKTDKAFDELEDPIQNFTKLQFKEAFIECRVISEMFDQNS